MHNAKSEIPKTRPAKLLLFILCQYMVLSFLSSFRSFSLADARKGLHSKTPELARNGIIDVGLRLEASAAADSASRWTTSWS
jgi:hypothetical protein